MNSPYEDMMDLPRHVSSSHPPMPRSLRAAQFAPFAALTGYSQVIRERSRLTVPKKIPGEDLQEELQRKLLLLAVCRDHPEVRITWFRPDARKQGGSYQSSDGRLENIDARKKILALTDGTRISLENILEIESSLFVQEF